MSNVPGEIAHYFEEMQAKEEQIQECRNVINQRDGSLQKFIKLNGSMVKNPREEPYAKVILDAYDRAERLQQEKVALCAKIERLLDRHVRKFDVKIRDLENEGAINIDNTLPSLLADRPSNLVERPSSTNTGANTPLHPLSGNTAGGASNLATNVAQRIMGSAAAMRMGVPSATGIPAHHPMMNPSHLQSVQAMSALSGMRAHRESSASSQPDPKRRRLNQTIPMPAVPSGLARQSSLGPGTPKASTPGSRQGSVGPRPLKKSSKKLAPHQMRKALLKKNKKRSRPGRSGISPSTTGEDDSNASEVDGSEDETASRVGADGAGDDMDVDDDYNDDNTKYCTCQQPSRGTMIGCDNAKCKYQWFHWECVGLTHEPEGDWLCPDCQKLPERQIKRVPDK